MFADEIPIAGSRGSLSKRGRCVLHRQGIEYDCRRTGAHLLSVVRNRQPEALGRKAAMAEYEYSPSGDRGAELAVNRQRSTGSGTCVHFATA